MKGKDAVRRLLDVSVGRRSRDRLRLRVAGVVVVALGVGGCTGAPADHPTPSVASSMPPSSLAWHDCAGKIPEGVRTACGSVTVPQDWANPSDGRTFDIAVIRVRSQKQSARIGSLLVNPGGPGLSGFDLPVQLAQSSRELAARFDFVGFDPRAVDRSAAVRCSSDADLDELYGSDLAQRSPVNFDTVIADTRDQIGRCVTKYGPSLRLYSTKQTAQDMDAIRAALSEEKVSYLGFSYGTLLGAAYAELFPTRLRAMVLDGPEDPRATAVAVAERNAKHFEQALNNFDAWCRQTECRIGPNARAAALNAVEHARKQPVKNAQGRQATAGWVFDAIFWAMYFDQLWPALVTAIDDLNHGRSDAVFSLADQYAGRDADGHYTNFTDAYEAIVCNDAGSQPTVEQIETLSQEWHKKYPVFGQRRALGLLDCTLWPVGHDPVPIGPAKGAPPIVVLAATGDPATPYEGAAALVSMLGTGTVVTRKADNHGSYLSGNACIDDAVHRYLIDLALPAPGLTCSG